jgi:cell wall-active antibiotic response 4TMS protein YvqF
MNTYLQNRFCPCVRCRMNAMLVPAVIVTIGVLLLLDNLRALYFNRTWPIILIVIGSIKVLQSSASTEGHRERSLPAAVAPPANPTTQDPNASASSTSSSEGR